MQGYIELQDQVQKTAALIAECERSIARSSAQPPFEALANIKTLQRLQQRQEATVTVVKVAESLAAAVREFNRLTEGA